MTVRRAALARRTMACAATIGTLAALCVSCVDRPETHHPEGTGHQVATGRVGTLLPAEDGDGGGTLRQVPEDQAPGVELTVRPDAVDGWTVTLDVTRFRFTPDSVGGAAVLGAGHAHLLVDGEKVARLYGRWHHLPERDVPPGARTLTARLVADDHTAWAVRGRPVEDSTPLPGAAEGDTRPRDPTPSGEPAAERTLEITVTDGRVTPAPGRVDLRRGRTLTLRVTSDTDDELHVHGMDRSVPLTAGRAASLRVTPERTGLFEVETHRSRLVLTQLAVR
ncbi:MULTISPECIES: cupredoxin domain-containing protein [unclassified Streptomyces]|uniref:cupredoxin domain-containing protein n=1 Tax=unclassified Streptomyces TaxID=2593676 RepID=UPI001F5BB6AE|nr:cupredoxin domain-containing protein [Streptomyces sp. HSG2]